MKWIKIKTLFQTCHAGRLLTLLTLLYLITFRFQQSLGNEEKGEWIDFTPQTCDRYHSFVIDLPFCMLHCYPPRTFGFLIGERRFDWWAERHQAEDTVIDYHGSFVRWKNRRCINGNMDDDFTLTFFLIITLDYLSLNVISSIPSPHLGDVS